MSEQFCLIHRFLIYIYPHQNPTRHYKTITEKQDKSLTWHYITTTCKNMRHKHTNNTDTLLLGTNYSKPNYKIDKN